jgi:hypothetical protein
VDKKTEESLSQEIGIREKTKEKGEEQKKC